ncbi:MAG: Mut7-C RNAse domain-containing protein [Anaerolineae bacterium]
MTGQIALTFIADAMLGSLARWLRLLGYDTLYNPQASDAELVRQARAEGRILLTRDRPLAARRGVKTLLIESQVLDEQLRQVIAACRLRPDPDRRRCAVCNGSLIQAAPSEVEGRVPPYVLKTQTHFRECAACGRIYWPGTHWAGMQARLAQLLPGKG